MRLCEALVMQVTSYLMMGALSPGLKRHSVTLFEGESLPSFLESLLRSSIIDAKAVVCLPDFSRTCSWAVPGICITRRHVVWQEGV